MPPVRPIVLEQGGVWYDGQVIPASWVKEFTTAHSWAKRIRQGYGYMWWTLPEDTWGAGAFYASGYGGQIIAVVSSKRLVVVQTVDLNQNPRESAPAHSSIFSEKSPLRRDEPPNTPSATAAIARSPYGTGPRLELSSFHCPSNPKHVTPDCDIFTTAGKPLK